MIKTMAKPRVVFVLGAPGSGKGTLCSLLAKKFGYTHFSAGDLLRQERDDPQSTVGDLLHTWMKDGKMVPSHITCQLLEKAIAESGNSKILIDGFPRNIENLTGWNDKMAGRVDLEFVLFIDCPEEICTERILKRAQTSGRTDDNIESVRKRFILHKEESVPVVEQYNKTNKTRVVISNEHTSPETNFNPPLDYINHVQTNETIEVDGNNIESFDFISNASIFQVLEEAEKYFT